jgi:hypothetical protein
VVTVKSEIQVTRAHRSIGEIHTLLSASL